MTALLENLIALLEYKVVILREAKPLFFHFSPISPSTNYY